MLNPPYKLKVLFILFLSLWQNQRLLAASLDLNSPIHIQSDVAFFEQKNRLAIHEGNVVMTQGSHELRADKLSIQQDAKGRLNLITATGKPATFSGNLTKDAEPVQATAKTIYYYPLKKLIVFEGSATLTHNQDKFKGPILSYHIEKQIVSATSQKNDRPNITFYPEAHQK